MPRVVFTKNLERHVTCPPVETPGNTIRAVLEAVFADNPKLRHYILDDQGHVRKHVMIAVNGEWILDRIHLTDPIPATAEVYIGQALSGG